MTTTETAITSSEKQAVAQYESIAIMIRALDFAEAHDGKDRDYLDEDDAKELDEILAESSDFDEENLFDRDYIMDRIQEDPLSVEVRSDWHSVGDEDGHKPTDFRILLCTGGPAVQIRGELDEHGQPDRCWMEHQDWGTPWTQVFNSVDNAVLLRYSSIFYFGEGN